MSTPHSKITAQGQISVPAEIRRKLGVGPGSVLEWDADGEHVIVRKAGRYSSEDIHKALFAKPPKRKALVEIKKGIGRHIKAKHARR
jgi:AbrB family looped-hinge helix DNA binding protein